MEKIDFSSTFRQQIKAFSTYQPVGLMDLIKKRAKMCGMTRDRYFLKLVIDGLNAEIELAPRKSGLTEE